MLGWDMGRKQLPKGERREVISISLKPATIQAIERLRGDIPRSKWMEDMVGHLAAIAGEIRPPMGIYCSNCYKTQKRDLFDLGETSQCWNTRCSLYKTTFFEVKVI